jgi:MOSC domain-containing protein YiiM
VAIIEKIYFKKDDIWNQKKQIDLHACELKEGKRNVSFITSEGNNRLINDRIRGFCHMKFKANFVVDGIDVDNLTVGELLQIGDAVIKITEIGKECYIDCPIIKKFNTLCAVNEQIFFGEVLEAGIVKEKDSITFLPLL